MGVFDFVRDAGAKVGVGDDKEKSVIGEVAETAKNAKAASLSKHVLDLGIAVDDLKVTFNEGQVNVSGSVADQAAREKIILALGNVEGVASVEDAIKVSESSAESTMHNVVAGDTLSKIAEAVYGDAAKYTVIFEANKPLLKDPDKIYVGQTLRIPAA